MTSSPEMDNFTLKEKPNDLQDTSDDDRSITAIMPKISKEQNGSENLETMCQRMMHRFSSASSSTSIGDKISLNLLPTATKLFIESFEKTEKSLSTISTESMGSTLTFWHASLEPWHEFLKHVKKVGPVRPESIRNLLTCVPQIIQTIFNYCKRRTNLYCGSYNVLMPQLTALFNKTNIVFDSFCSIIENAINFDDADDPENGLATPLNKICDTAIMIYGLDTKTWLNAWKNFMNIAIVHEKLIKKSNTTECITRRYTDMASSIPTILHDNSRNKKETNHERDIKCAGLLLKILVKLCKLYRGYCGKKDSEAIVKLLVELQRYCPPFPRGFFDGSDLKIVECSNNHLVRPINELLNTLRDEKEFIKAFFDYEKSEDEEPIYYHLLILRMMRQLVTQEQSAISSWLGANGNIIDTALVSANDCCAEILINDVRIPMNWEIGFGDSQDQDVYRATLELLCNLVGLMSNEEFEAVEMALLKHLLGGQFWSSLMCCDLWTFLGRIIPSELCHEHLSFLLKVQQSLITRDKSFEFGILTNLIGRLYKLLPDETKDSVFTELGDYSNRRLLDPFVESLTPGSRQFLLNNPSIDTRFDLKLIFQDLRNSPSVHNWTRLTSLLRSIGAAAIPNDERACIPTLDLIWDLDIANISEAQGVIREMLLELTAILLDCDRIESVVNPNKDELIASIYKSMMEMIDHVPTELRIKMIVFFRENLDSCGTDCGKLSLQAKTELVCALAKDKNPWVRQESFETYVEDVLNGPSTALFDNISVGISKFPILSQQISSYFSNERINDFANHETLENYLTHLAEASKNFASSHNCYEPDYRQRDEKMPRIETNNIDDHVVKICDELRRLLMRKNELDDSSIDALRRVLLQLLEN